MAAYTSFMHKRPDIQTLNDEIFSLHWPLLLSDKRAQTDNGTGAGRIFTSVRDDVAYRLTILVTLRGWGVLHEDRHSHPA
jgi:hypothetical protein